jgi:hypothetical protein
VVVVRSFVAVGESTQQTLSNLGENIDRAPSLRASLVCLFYDSRHDDASIHAFVQRRFPGAAILGGTSCSGVMSETGLAGSGSIGLLIVDDPDGDYGTAAVALEGNATDCAEQALHAALENAGCQGELPELVWIYQAPGREEAVIQGLRRVVGDRCPIIGGSSADNDVAGNWRQFGPEGPISGGLVVGVLFSSGGIGFAFQGGYEPSGESGIVTRVGSSQREESEKRGREIISIDGEPAAEVYNRWTGGVLTEKLETGGNILGDTSMFPVAIDAGETESITNYLLIHPDRILPGGTLSTFAEIEEGTRLFSMRGNKPSLVDRAGKVASAAAATLPGGPDSLAGGLVVYCAGCMLAVGDEMPKVATAVSESFKGKPFIGCFTFGEQGAMLGRNAHGNLMISAIAFAK